MSNEVSPAFENVLTALKAEKVIAYPTEAVFGLGCDPDSVKAINELLILKKRPWQKGLILIADNYEQLQPYLDDKFLTEKQKEVMLACWPGPMTWVIPAKSSTSKWLTGQFSTLAVRVSDHPLVKKLCTFYGKPLVSTSANLNGLEPCRTVEEVRQQFGDKLPVLNGNVGGRENPSEIRDVLTGELYRQG
ncbi:Threonylcarbamoyl-AMP synthase [Photorhabdus australis subsp. thailandensis]|uniref:Threonylcarbamoyl-AMP synthase n=1 Tax=Photorhabdus australis subsp. thailandensis TaxID=2805096 RepID=A0A1C0U2R8_9GAMM|nr:L-threonylcarbamoyladenylate synthase type 1 TsaC [Photorhabdus australis]OCQ52181.1 Threonylcarbamoyl-AMP synthase [Photorhabdus australis subsp. thailandensis]